MQTTTTHTPRGRHVRSGEGLTAWLAALLALFVLGLFARFWQLGTAYELFIDEVTYADLAVSVAQGDGVRLHGEPFHLHPPGFFATSGLLIWLQGSAGAGLADVAYGLRPLPALLGSLIPVVVAEMVRRASGSWLAALAAGLLLALDPFLLRFDSRVLLEAQAMLLAAAGTLLLLVLAQRREAGRSTPAWLVVLTGLVLGCSLLSKETYAFVAVLPVLVLLVTGLVLPRRTTAQVFAVITTVYLAYVAGVAAVGQLPGWFDQKTRGVQRLLGLVQETGFNREGSPSFLDRLLVNLGSLGVTYALIGLGSLASAWLLLLLLRRRPLPGASRSAGTVLVVWSLGALSHLGYAITIGTLEEQMFYLLVVTAVPVLCLAVCVLLGLARESGPDGWGGRVTRLLPTLVAVLLVAALTVEASVWWRIRSVPDDGYARLLEWVETDLPPGERLATTEELAQFALDDRLVVRVETGEEVRELGAQYVLVISELLEQGYSRADEEMLGIIEAGEVLYSTDTRTLGRIAVHRIDPGTTPEG